KFKHNGKEIYVKADMEFIKVAQNLRPKEFDAFSQILRMPVNTFTRLTTSANPFFALVNIPRDQLTALFTTKTGMIPVFHPVKSLIHLIKGTPLAKKYVAIGGKRQTLAAYMDLSPEDVTHKLTGGETKTEKVGRVLNSSLGILEIPSNYSEIMTRLAEFEGAKKKGLSDLEAMYRATDVTIPFQLQGNYGGTLGREYIKSVAYMNANMQGLYKTIRSAKEQLLRLATVTAGAIASALTSTILMMMYSDDEQKRLLSNQPVKELSRAIFFPSPNGKDLIRIPIPDLIGGITGLVQLFVISQYDGNKSSFKDYATAILQGLPQQLNPIEFKQWWTSLIPQVAKPVTEIIFNKRTYPEVAPIVPDYLRKEKPERQYNDYTSKVANYLGEVMGVSPMYIEHFVKGQFGTLGNLLIGLPEGRYMNRIGLYRQEERFVMSGRAYNRFYDLKDQILQEYNAINDDNNIDPGYYTNVKSKKIITDEISEIFSDATKVLKKEKNLPENVKKKGYDLLLSIYNNESENKIIRLTEEYSKSVTKMLKDKNIETDRKDFTKTGLRLTIVKDRMDKLLDLWERTGNEKYKDEWNKLNDELGEIKDTDWYKEQNKLKSDKSKETKKLKSEINE
ncbi:MAG: LPD38 domain-containing protein, partial [Ignavibacteria bacterium]